MLFLWWNMVRRAMAGPGSQYDDFVKFARDLLFEHENLYRTYPADNTITKYPPFFAFVYAPLVPLPVWLGASIWFWVSLACAAGAAVASALAVGATAEELRRRPSLVLVPFLLIAGVVISNLETGQVNLFVLFFWTLGLLFVEQGHEGRGGGLIGFTTAVKITSGIFIPFFIWIWRWRAAMTAVFVLGLCWGLALKLGLGSREFYGEVMQSWFRKATPFLTEGGLAEGEGGFRHTNQSFSAVLYRFATRTPALAGREGFYVNFVTLGSETIRWIINGAVLGLLAVLVWVTRGLGRGPEGDLRRGFGSGLVMMATLFLSPISWINHYVLLLFPYAAAWRYVATRPAGDPGRRLLLWCLVVSAILVATGISQLLLAFSLPFFGAAVLFAGMAVVLQRQRPEEQAELRLAGGAAQ